MKKFTKLLGIVLIIALVMSMGITALAAGTRTITITPPTNTPSGVTNSYNIYKVFDAVADANGNISYTLMAGKSAPIIKDADTSLSKFDVDTAGNVHYYTRESASAEWVVKTTAGGTLTADDIAALAAYVNGDTAKYTATSKGTTNAVAENVEDGYYFITTSTGSAVTVDSTTPNATVIDKNTIPDIEKTVQEDSLVAAATSGADGDGVTAYQKQNDVEIGQKVYYKTVVSAKPNGKGYVVYDKMDSALDFVENSIKIYEGSISDSNLLTLNTEYTVAYTGKYMKGSSAGTATESGDATFIITFADAYLDTITEATNIIILYEATLNNTAVVNTGYLNDTTLKYGNETSNYSNEKETKTYTWGIDVTKQDGTDNTKKLAGAEFVIYRTETVTSGEGPEATTTTNIYYATFTNNKLTGWSAADTKALADLYKEESSYFTGKGATVLTTGSDGKITVGGLDEGTYGMIETKAPTGYNKLATSVDVTINSTSDETVAQSLTNPISAETSGNKTVTVDNNKGTELPSTGGIGTTIFYVVGSILVVAAGVLLITKKRMGRE